MIKKFNRNNRGFTIIETIISIFIFSIVALLVSGIFGRMIDVQRRATSAQLIQENAMFVLELISREVRVSQIISPDSLCSTSSLSIIHPTNGDITYSLTNGIVMRDDDGVLTELSSSEVDFTGLNFCISGAPAEDNRQPRITIVASVESRAPPVLTTNIQTTVTSRDLRDEF